MRKLIGLVLIFSLLFMVSGTVIYASDSHILSYSKAYKELLSNNRTLKKLDIMKHKTRLQIRQANITSSQMQSTLDKMKKYHIPISISDKFQLVHTRDLVPKQADYGYNLISEQAEVTKNGLVLGLRNLYLGLYQAYKNMDISERKLILEKEKFKQTKLKYDQGSMDIDKMKDSQQSLLASKTNFESAKRNFENISRSINTYIGQDIDIQYDKVILAEEKGVLEPLETYLRKAQDNRFDITDIQDQLKLKQFELNIYEQDNYLSNTNLRKDYEKIKDEVEKLNIQLEMTKEKVEMELRNFYIEALSNKEQIALLNNSIEIQKNRLDYLKKLSDKEMVNEITVKELENGIKDMQIQKELLIFRYNTTILKLDYASSIGTSF